ncbi:hypothetical protein K2173_001944 [Erythroxylum novogranatense]|uniref:Pollen Ole e 1 allergen and extensin family protein n=1 Tax=Erythroxylum novogranatense TaxID=1862640 RepID=A0AAV8SP48_9ROSI|nr:hypothetical protein K2173_001944 [Erythroxylum novogranatense]
MAALALMWLVAASVLVGSTNLVMGLGEAVGFIHVGGKVMCQDCTKNYNAWINGDRPIKGCRVSLTCMDEGGRVIYYGSDETNEQGQFEMTLSKVLNGKELKEKLCSVRLVSSPNPTCNVLTDFAGGKSGVKLRGPSLVYRDLIKYVLAPFYFTSPICDRPDTTQSDGGYTNRGSQY